MYKNQKSTKGGYVMLGIQPITTRVAPIARKSAPKLSEAAKKIGNVKFNSMPSAILDKQGKLVAVKYNCGSGGSSESSCIGDIWGSALPMGFAC